MKVYTLILFLAFLLGASAEQCGSQAGGAVCANGLCCSKFGWCGSTADYCGTDCHSQCNSGRTPAPPNPTPSPTPSGGGDIGNVISAALFDQLLKYRNDEQCKSNSSGFYAYNAFIAAAQSFGGFGTTGDDNTRKREIAAFLAQTSHETTGGWPSAPDGPYAWGYCFITENNKADYCTQSTEWPCFAGKQYYGRDPFNSLSNNYNYGQAGKAIGADLLINPDLVATDATISFKTAIWFWMTPQGNKPSCHDVNIGEWTPSAADTAAGRVPGYGVITNIINGRLECGKGTPDPKVADRIGFYKRYCDILKVSYGDNLDCNNQNPFD
ncbi:endochitinase 4-like [Alnus glutinosa]|uniref:endochitinase 4-like n=1 Tax=Alnus glutinosa TaxID=3517 RepID=UPI002D79D6AC|nr:endochitinase 4-like [Alnus glutinosa]